MRKVVLILSLAAFIALCVALNYFLQNGVDPRLRALSPSGDLIVFALPFRDRDPHPLDGKLRVFLSDRAQTFTDKHQTSLPVTRRTYLEWIPGANPPMFQVRDSQGTRMVWQVQGRTAVCVQGKEFLAPDPYLR